MRWHNTAQSSSSPPNLFIHPIIDCMYCTPQRCPATPWCSITVVTTVAADPRCCWPLLWRSIPGFCHNFDYVSYHLHQCQCFVINIEDRDLTFHNKIRWNPKCIFSSIVVPIVQWYPAPIVIPNTIFEVCSTAPLTETSHQSPSPLLRLWQYSLQLTWQQVALC